METQEEDSSETVHGYLSRRKAELFKTGSYENFLFELFLRRNHFASLEELLQVLVNDDNVRFTKYMTETIHISLRYGPSCVGEFLWRSAGFVGAKKIERILSKNINYRQRPFMLDSDLTKLQKITEDYLREFLDGTEGCFDCEYLVKISFKNIQHKLYELATDLDETYLYDGSLENDDFFMMYEPLRILFEKAKGWCKTELPNGDCVSGKHYNQNLKYHNLLRVEILGLPPISAA